MEPPARDTPSTVARLVLESGQYYQVRITPRALERRWDLEADSMLPRGMDMPEGPTPLVQGQLPDRLTAMASHMAGTWQPQYCLWRWAQRKWQHISEWSATWRFHLDCRQQAEVILPHYQAAGGPATDNLCPVIGSTRSEHWRRDWCHPPSARRRKHEHHIRPS